MEFQEPAPLVPLGRLLRLVPAVGLAASLAACTPSDRCGEDLTVEDAPVPTAPATVVPTAERPRSILAHPADALVPQSRAEEQPCDGSASEQPLEPVLSEAPAHTEPTTTPPTVAPPPVTRLAGKPMVRVKGKRKPPTPTE